MKRKFSLLSTLPESTVAVFSQPAKLPVKTVTTGVKPMKITRVALGPLSYEYKSDNGHMDISYARSKGTKNDVSTTTTPAKSVLCLTKEEGEARKSKSKNHSIDIVN